MLYSVTATDVRAVLGVSITEIPDSVLALTMFDNLVSLELEDISLTLATDYTTVNAIVSKTAADLRFLKVVTLYTTYLYANLCLEQLPLFAVQTLTDGRASFTRQSDPYESVKVGIAGMLSSLKVRLLSAYAALYPATTLPVTAATFTSTLSTGLAIDPVTNA